MATRRTVGVTLTAVVAFLGSALLLLLAVAMIPASFLSSGSPGVPPDAQKFLKLSMIGVDCVLALVAIGGISTGVGLLRLRPWSRVSALVFSSILVFLGGSSVLFMSFMQLPETPGTPAGMNTYIKAWIVGFYAILGLLGAFWLYFFNKRSVKKQFSNAERTITQSARPLSITIIAALVIFGAAGVLFCALPPLPAVLFGLVVKGWAARAVYLTFAVISVALGIGLLRLNPLSRVLTIAFLTYTVVSTLLYFALPGYPDRERAFMAFMPASFQTSSAVPTPSRTLIVIATLPIAAIQIWFLIARRRAFEKQPPFIITTDASGTCG